MRRSAQALLTLLLVSSIALPALASPQPTPVCGTCGAGFELALEREDIDATVTASTAEVQVHDDGSATWRVTNQLANASTAAELEDDPTALREAVGYALQRGTVEGPFENVSARVENRTVVVTFRDRYATTETPGGIQILDYFHTRGYDSWPVLTADRISVVGPDGTVVTNDPPGATVSGRNATWTGNASAPTWDAPRVDSDAYVAFGERGAATPALTVLGIALATLPIVVDVVGSVHAPPLLLLGLVLAGSTAATRALGSRVGTRRVAVASVGLGAVALAWSVSVGSVFFGTEPSALAIGFGGAALAMGGLALASDRGRQPKQFAGAGVLALVFAAVVAVVTLPADYPTARAVEQAGRVILLLPLAVAPLLGAAITTGSTREAAGWWLLALVGFFLGELALVAPTQRPFGAVVFMLGAYALGAGLLALPFLLLGATAAEPTE